MTPRAEVDRTGDERAMLTQMLDYYRASMEFKVAGITDDQARTAAIAPSDLNLLGLVRHLADVERSWFRVRFAGQPLPPLFFGESHPTGDIDGDLHPGPDDTVAHAIDALHAEIAAARVITQAAALDQMAANHGDREPFNLRWVLVHLIEEYARHVGHADLLRERIDGSTGP